MSKFIEITIGVIAMVVGIALIRMNFIIGLILMLLASFIFLTRRHHSYV